MTYVREQTSQELRVHMKKLQAMAGWHEPLADRLWQEVQALEAKVKELEESQAAQSVASNQPQQEQAAPAVQEDFLRICQQEVIRSKITSLPQKLERMKLLELDTLDAMDDWMRATRKAFVDAVEAVSNTAQQVRGNAQEPVAWTAAVEKAAQDAAYVFKDSCNHTAQAIDYMKAVLHASAPQVAQEEGAREKPYLWFHEKSRTIHQTDMPFAFLKDCIPLYKGPQPDAQQSEKDK